MNDSMENTLCYLHYQHLAPGGGYYKQTGAIDREDYIAVGMEKIPSYIQDLKHRMKWAEFKAMETPKFAEMVEDGGWLLSPVVSYFYPGGDVLPGRARVCDDYDIGCRTPVEEIIVLSPGKFEMEPAYLPIAYDHYLSGFGEDTGVDGMTMGVSVDDRMKEQFPSLKRRNRILMREDENGFVYEIRNVRGRRTKAR